LCRPRGWAEAFNVRQRNWVFPAKGVTWLVLIIGSVTSFFAG
jgi:hypothetical protein